MSGRISVPAAVLGFQGATNVAIGIYGLVQPAAWTSQLASQFSSDVPIAMGYAISLQLLNMGIFTLFAANRPSLHRQALIARTCLHAIAGYLFWNANAELKSAAIVDLGSAVVDALVLLVSVRVN